MLIKYCISAVIVFLTFTTICAQNNITLYDGAEHEKNRYGNYVVVIPTEGKSGCISLHNTPRFHDKTSYFEYNVSGDYKLTFHTGDCNLGEGFSCHSLDTSIKKKGKVQLVNKCNDQLSAIYWEKIK